MSEQPQEIIHDQNPERLLRQGISLREGEFDSTAWTHVSLTESHWCKNACGSACQGRAT